MNAENLILFEKKAEFVSWCIEEYAAQTAQKADEVAKRFSQNAVIDFLENHYDVLHTQGKQYILGAITDFMQ
ncbi:MAG: DUF3791 domain-containing protein [Bacteroidales bacterium]|nr:DUF3791 domain-containing protein [Bacteroidales bacterium]